MLLLLFFISFSVFANKQQDGFIENKGQIVDQNNQSNSDVLYLLSRSGINLQLKKNSFSYDTWTVEWKQRESTEHERILYKDFPDVLKDRLSYAVYNFHRVDIELTGANSTPEVNAENPFSDIFNYYVNDKEVTGVKQYSKIIYKDIYPHIDLEFFIRNNIKQGEPDFEYQFIVHPGGNTEDIRLKYSGSNGTQLLNGKIVVSVAHGQFSEKIPASFTNNDKLPVKVKYKESGKDNYVFLVEAYPKNKTLVIDPWPQLLWATYYGGTSYEKQLGVCSDIFDNAYIAGHSYSVANIATAGAHQSVRNLYFDGYVVKLNSTGQRIWATYYGGEGYEYMEDVAIDATGNIYAAGSTFSTTAISTAGSHQPTLTAGTNGEEGFLVKFDNNGVRQWGTYYGGSVYDKCTGIAIAPSGSVYLCGMSNSSNNIATAGTHQPVAAGYTEVFIAKFSDAGVRDWGTYFGGIDTEFMADGIAVDASENIYITGRSNSSAGIATTGAFQETFEGDYDAFIAKFTSSGIRVWATYFGGTMDERGFDIRVNTAGEIYSCGWTASTGNISTAGAFQEVHGGGYDGYIIKLDNNGNRLISTYFGGASDDMFNGIDFNQTGDLIISGSTKGSLGLATEYVYQSNYMGTEDMTLLRFDTSLERIWYTYFGGSLTDNSWDVCVTANDYIYVTGDSKSLSNVGTPGVHQPTFGGGTLDGYLARFVDCSMISTDSHVMPLCYGDANGTATVTPEYGTPMYYYLWENTLTTQTISDLAAGDYFVTIADTRGCLWWDTVTVTQPNPLFTQAIGTDALCFGGSEGTISSIPAGGTPLYSYLWDNGCTDSTCLNVPAGTYIVTVYDANNCTTSETVTIGQPTIIEISFNPTDALCNGSSDGVAIAATSGGTPNPGYNFLWSNGSITDTAYGLPAGEHYITVTDGNGCTMTDTVLIGQPDTLLMTFIETAASCFGYNDGILDVTVTGGIIPYQYLWDNGDTTNFADTLAAGSYFVTITDDHNCSVVGNSLISEPTMLTSTFDSIYNASCNGFSDGFVSVLPTGGTPGYFYNWSSGSDSSSASGLFAGIYYLTLTDSHNCLYLDTVTVSEPDTINVTFSNTLNLCFGDSTGISQAFPTGGTSPYLINWSNGNSGDINNSLTAGIYTLTVTDDHGCVFESLTEVFQPDSIQIIFVADSAACNGDANGKASIIILGGTNPFSYLWSTGSVNDTIFNLAAGNYSVTVSDANNCIQSDYVTIGQPSPLRLFVNYFHLTCFQSHDGYAEASAMGGVPPYQFLWSTGYVGTDLINLTAGNYGVTVYDSHGCTESLNFTITQPDLLVTNGYSIDVVCYGDNTGAAYVITNGGTTPYTYLWNNGYNLQIDSAIVAGTYIITTTDSHGCTDIDTITVNEPDELLLTMDYQNVLCYNHANGWAQSTVTGGILPYDYIWNTGDTTSSITNLVPGQYSLLVTDNNLCTTEYYITITQPDSLYYDYSVQNITCNSFNNGAVTGNVVGGTVPYHIWFENDYHNQMPFNNLSAGTYYLHITDLNACVFNDTIVITQPDTLLPVVNFGIDPSDNYGFADLTVTGGTQPYYYEWSNNTFNQDISHLIGGNYTVTITDDNGCISTSTFLIDLILTVPDVITPNNDGYNDNFEILNLEAFNTIKLYIYNRWGTMLYSFEGTTQEYNNGNRFNGTANGKKLPMGSYAYILIINEDMHYTGALLIKY